MFVLVTTRQFRVKIEESGARIEKFLSARLPELSRKRIRRCLDRGDVAIDAKTRRFASTRVRANARVTINLAEAPTRPAPKDFDSSHILYDRNGILAIAKAPGVCSGPTRSQGYIDVGSWLGKAFSGAKRFYPCHRLDAETSGVLLLASDRELLSALTQQFRERRVQKEYLALSYGLAKRSEWTSRCYLSAICKRSFEVKRLRAGGRYAETHFQVLASVAEPELSLIEARPLTGRSHQLRVQLKSEGLAIVGDKRYCQPGLSSRLSKDLLGLCMDHHFLHARALEFSDPCSRERIRVVAPLPLNFLRFAQKVGLACKTATT